MAVVKPHLRYVLCLSLFFMPQTKALRGSRRPEVTFETRAARPGGVLNTAYLEAIDNDDYESESDDEGPSQRDNLRRRALDVSASRRTYAFFHHRALLLTGHWQHPLLLCEG